MSLWGTKQKKDDDPAEQNGESTSRPHSRRDFDDSRMREPTERDRLLPADNRRPPHADGYLDPDDPAVSDVKAMEKRCTLANLPRCRRTICGQFGL